MKQENLKQKFENNFLKIKMKLLSIIIYLYFGVFGLVIDQKSLNLQKRMEIEKECPLCLEEMVHKCNEDELHTECRHTFKTLCNHEFHQEW